MRIVQVSGQEVSVEIDGSDPVAIGDPLTVSRVTAGRVAKAPPGPAAVKGTMLEGWLPAHLRSNPDLTLEEHCEAFAEDSGVKVSEATMSRAISLLPGGWPLKKRAR